MKFISLKYKLLYFSFITSLVLTGVSAFLEINSDIRDHQSRLQKELMIFQEENTGFLSRKVWTLDYPSVVNLATNELKSTLMDRVTITDIGGEVITDQGRDITTNSIRNEFDLYYLHNDRKVIIGHVVSAGNIPDAGDILSERWQPLFIANGLFITIIFLFSYTLFHRNVLVHLLDIIRFTNRQEKDDEPISQIYIPPRKIAPDEINLLVNALNNRTQRIDRELSKRIAAETSIRKKNLQLLQEINERRRMEKAILSTEEKYRLLVENANDAIFIAQNGYVKFPNPKTLELTGYTAAELESTPFADIIHTGDRALVLDRHTRRLQGEKLPSTYTFRIVSKSGTVKTVQINTVMIQWEGAPATLNFLRDISEQKALEEQVRQSHKMEAIGTLTGGIAHDFNNLLGIIIGNMELAVDTVPEWNPARLHLDEAMTASLRAKNLVGRLLNFSRKTDISRKPVQIRSTVRETIALLRASIPTTIEIRLDAPDNLPAINADETQIQQIIINLCTNAAHSMESHGGILTVGLKGIELTKPFTSPSYRLDPGNYVRMTVSDTGHGIRPEILEKVFDPYFTTKDIGKGTGMGLAVVHGIVQNHDGAIDIQSSPDRGTAVTVLFPALDMTSANPPATVSEAMLTGTERILFVDDEPAITRMAETSLERLGYQVTTRTDSNQALELFKDAPQAFDLVITDMTMPKMTGDQLANGILAIRPEIPIILCTGYSSRVSETNAPMFGFRAFAAKPLVTAELAETIRAVLDHPH